MCGMTNTTGSGDKMEVIEWGNLMGDGKNEAMFTKDDDIASLTIQLSAALRREEVLREALLHTRKIARECAITVAQLSPSSSITVKESDQLDRVRDLLLELDSKAALSACDEGRK